MLLGYCAGMKRIVVFMSFVLALSLLQAHAQQNPDDQYIMIYALMQQAERWPALLPLTKASRFAGPPAAW